jgi:hypothetical protein
MWTPLWCWLGAPLVIAALVVHEGVSALALKLVLIGMLLVGSGAVTVAAFGRSTAQRAGLVETDSPLARYPHCPTTGYRDRELERYQRAARPALPRAGRARGRRGAVRRSPAAAAAGSVPRTSSSLTCSAAMACCCSRRTRSSHG